MSAIEELKLVARKLFENEEERLDLVVQRNELARKARAEDATWRSIAGILGMTEHGIIKAAKNSPNWPQK